MTTTDEQIQEMYDEMVKMFGDKLPNPEHEPLRFKYFIKLYKYYKASDK